MRHVASIAQPVPTPLPLLAPLSALTLVGVLLLSLARPARAWIGQVPKPLARIELALSAPRQPSLAATHAGDQIAEPTNIGGEGKMQPVVEAGPSRIAQMLSATPAALASMIGTLLLTFIFLLQATRCCESSSNWLRRCA